MIYRPLQALQSLTRFQDLAAGDLVMTGTPGGTALSAPPKPIEIIGSLLPPAVKWKAFFKRQANNPKYLQARRRRRTQCRDRRRRHRPWHPAHRREVRVTRRPRSRSSSSAQDPTGVTAATLLAQYGIECLVLDRWADVYPQPRAVHLDDEIYRILARLGIADEFAAISRPALGLRLLDPRCVCSPSSSATPRCSVNGFPQANMFDQPDLEKLLRANLKRYPSAELARRRRSHRHRRRRATDASGSPSSTAPTAPSTSSRPTTCWAATAPTASCAHASAPPCSDLKFEQRWLVVDVATDADLDQWDGVHQVCDPVRAAHLHADRRSRYRWEFRLLPGETADDYSHPRRAAPADRAVDRACRRRRARADPRHGVHLPGPDRRPVAAAETSSCSATPHTSLRRSSARAWARDCATR